MRTVSKTGISHRMDIDINKIKKSIKVFWSKLPFYFERYEVIVILVGALVCFSLAGLVFYTKAYKVVESLPEVEAGLLNVNTALFEKTIVELEQRKIMAPDLPIIDPFK